MKPAPRTAIPVLLALAAAVCFLPAVSFGEPEPSPEAAYRAKVAEVFGPGNAGAFRCETRFVMGGKVCGTCVFTAQVADLDGEAVWKVRDLADMKMGDDTLKADIRAFLSPRLSALSGAEINEESGVAREVRWKRTDSGCEIEVAKPGDGDLPPVKSSGPLPDHAITTVSGLMLFCRLAMPEKAVYAVSNFNPDPDEGEERVERYTVRFEGIGEWHGREAYLVKVEQEGARITVALDPESREVLGLSLSLRGITMEFLTEGIPITQAAPSEFSYSPPARTPLQAGFLTALAFSTGDRDLMDKTIHWPTLLASFRAAHPEVEITQEKFRATVCGRLSRYPDKKPRELVVSLLESIRSKVEVEMDGEDRARVSFPEAFGNLTLNVVKVGEFWFVASVPR